MTKTLLVATEAAFSDVANEELKRIAEKSGLEVAIHTKKDLGNLEAHPELAEDLERANALVVRSDKVTPAVFDAAPNLELVIRGGAGYNNIDTDYATSRDVTVMNTPGQNSNAVAELAMTLAGNLLRKVHLLDPTTKEGLFEKKRFSGMELAGKKLGIHGVGYIGSSVAKKARAYDMDVYAFDPFVNKDVAKDLRITLVDSMEELYKDAFMVSLHLPENDHTRELIAKGLLSLMDKSGILINTARAGIINEDDLEAHLKENPNFGYAADVHTGGDKAGEKRFAKFGDQVILTPHIGASTGDANYNCAVAAANQAVGFFNDGDMSCAVNRDVVPFWMKDYADLAQKLGYVNALLVDGQPKEVRVIAYEELNQYRDALAGNVLKGMMQRKELKPAEAFAIAENNQIAMDLREPNPDARHGNSITIDYYVEKGGKLQSSNLRGTVTDGEMKISRINGFYNFDLELMPGVALMFMYEDKEGLADEIGHPFTVAGFNKISGTFKPERDGNNAMYAFYIEKRDGSEIDLAHVKSIVSSVEKMRPEVYRTAILDFR